MSNWWENEDTTLRSSPVASPRGYSTQVRYYNLETSCPVPEKGLVLDETGVRPVVRKRRTASDAEGNADLLMPVLMDVGWRKQKNGAKIQFTVVWASPTPYQEIEHGSSRS